MRRRQDQRAVAGNGNRNDVDDDQREGADDEHLAPGEPLSWAGCVEVGHGASDPSAEFGTAAKRKVAGSVQSFMYGDHEDGGEHQRRHRKSGGREGLTGDQSIEGDRRHDQERGERDEPGRQAAGQAKDPERLLGILHGHDLDGGI